MNQAKLFDIFKNFNLVSVIFVLAIFKPFIENWFKTFSVFSFSIVQIFLCSLAIMYSLVKFPISTLVNKRILIIFPLILWLGMSLTWSSDAVYGIEKYQYWIINAILPLIAIYTLMFRFNQKINWELYKICAFIFTVVILLFGSGERTSIDGLNVIWTSRIALISLSILILLPYKKPIDYIISVGLLIVAFQAESRGPVISFLIPLVAYFLYVITKSFIQSKIKIDRLILITFLSSALFIVSSYWFFDRLSEIISDSRYSAILNNNLSSEDYYDRSNLLASAKSAWLQSPILGDGLGGYSQYYYHYYPHNLIAEIGAESGIIGVLFYVLYLISTFYMSMRINKIFAVLFLQCVLYSMFSGSIASNPDQFILSAIILALYSHTFKVSSQLSLT